MAVLSHSPLLSSSHFPWTCRFGLFVFGPPPCVSGPYAKGFAFWSSTQTLAAYRGHAVGLFVLLVVLVSLTVCFCLPAPCHGHAVLDFLSSGRFCLTWALHEGLVIMHWFLSQCSFCFTAACHVDMPCWTCCDHVVAVSRPASVFQPLPMGMQFWTFCLRSVASGCFRFWSGFVLW